MRRSLPSLKRTARSEHRSNRQNVLARSVFNRRLVCEALENRWLLSGVTLITHGFNDNVDGWVTAMAKAVANQIATHDQCPVSDVAEMRLTVQTDLSVQPQWVVQPNLNTSKCDETIVLLDWSAVAGSILDATKWPTMQPTQEVADHVAPYLLQAMIRTDLAQPFVLAHPLAEASVHLIGHSRGGSLVGALAENLGRLGVWVDQVTTLDPHPLGNSALDFAFFPLWLNIPGNRDASMQAWDNVKFWDNYWETGTSYPHGELVSGAYNNPQSLEFPAEGYSGLGADHSNVHLWYQGTIDGTNGVFSINAWKLRGFGPFVMKGCHSISAVVLL